VTSIASRLADVRARVHAAATSAGRDATGVLLVAVGKGMPVDAIAEAAAAGQRDFGENRAQELVGKAASLADGALGDGSGQPIAWHFVGRLQRNKVRTLVPYVARWHSVDRTELGREIVARRSDAPVLVEVNIANEPQKGGCLPADTARLVDELRSLGVSVDGLMTVPPIDEDPRPHFAALRTLAERLALAELSMGMTADFEAAIAEGATIVRVGTAIFGPRR
jgi:pyridoxal phosphate enzyme (YggS family)